MNADSKRVIAIARSWLGTPYHDQASLRGVGCDCLGLARGVWREVVGPEPFPIPAYSRDWGETGPREVLAEGASYLAELLARQRSADWVWFESRLGYDNARLPQALIEAGDLLEERAWLTAGLDGARWLARLQTGAGGLFRPVGSNGLGRDREMLPFDQQPLEAQATVDACAAAFAATGDARWIAEAQRAYRWFLGANDLDLALASAEDGGCFDGLTPQGLNRNQGAESILALQLASITIAELCQYLTAGETVRAVA